MNQLSVSEISSFQEKMFLFPGFYIQKRSIRQYQYPYAAHVLGDVGEADPDDIEADKYYQRGDYIGKQGVERSYETALRASDSNPLVFADKAKKNVLNGLDEEYFSEIKSHSLKFFTSITTFLKDPRNAVYLKDYLNTTSELRGYIQRHSADHTFKDILETIIENIIGADPYSDVFKERMMVRVFVHYMYWNCDIGRKE